MQETWVRSLGWEDPPEKGMAAHSSILAWENPMDRGAWQATVHGFTKSQILLSTDSCLVFCHLKQPDIFYIHFYKRTSFYMYGIDFAESKFRLNIYILFEFYLISFHLPQFCPSTN